MTQLSEQGYAAAIELQDLRHQASINTKRQDELKKLIHAELGTELTGLLASGVQAVHVEVSHRNSVNSAKLQAMYPEVYDSVVEETEVRSLKVDLD